MIGIIGIIVGGLFLYFVKYVLVLLGICEWSS